MSEHLGPEDLIYWIDPAHQEEFSRYLRKKFGSLTDQDFEDLWAEAIRQLLEQLLSGRSAPRKSLGGLLLTILRRRASDMLRRTDTRERTLDEFQEQSKASAGLNGDADTEAGCDWLEFVELQEIFARTLEQLDADERLLLSVYCEEYPKARGPVTLLKILSERDPDFESKNWTKTTVARLLDRARATMQAELLKKGY